MNDSLRETGKCAAASLREMVAALDVDYDRLEEWALERAELMREWMEANPDAELDAAPAMADELKELIDDAGECTSREDAETRIHEDALSVEVRSGWFTPGISDEDERAPVEFNILLATGGPAVRIMGELRDGEAHRAYLQVQNWGTPWTDYYEEGLADVCLAYARCFYFGEG